MKYNIEDIDFTNISPREFENLCYDLLIKYNYHNLVWREGGADNGRDIEAYFSFNNQIQDTETKWFFECKHYNSGGVPPSELNSKIAWADAEQPDYVVFFVSSYLTNNSRTWFEKIVHQKQYNIKVIEGEEIKNRLLKYPELIERYFSLTKYEQLFKNIKDYKTKFNINPSFEFLKEIIENIDLAKLDTDEIGFLLFSFYSHYRFFENRNEYFGDFDESLIYRVLEYLKLTVTNDTLKSFEKYRDDSDILRAIGIFDEMYWLDDEDNMAEMQLYNFYNCDLHLNYSKEQTKWKLGYYLFVIFENSVIEVFHCEKTEIRIIKNFKAERINELSLKLPDDIVTKYTLYLKYFNA